MFLSVFLMKLLIFNPSKRTGANLHQIKFHFNHVMCINETFMFITNFLTLLSIPFPHSVQFCNDFFLKHVNSNVNFNEIKINCSKYIILCTALKLQSIY